MDGTWDNKMIKYGLIKLYALIKQ